MYKVKNMNWRRNIFTPEMKDFSRHSPPTVSRIHRKSGSIKEMVKDRHTTNKNYHMAYQFMPFPMTSKVICLSQHL